MKGPPRGIALYVTKDHSTYCKHTNVLFNFSSLLFIRSTAQFWTCRHGILSLMQAECKQWLLLLDFYKTLETLPYSILASDFILDTQTSAIGKQQWSGKVEYNPSKFFKLGVSLHSPITLMFEVLQFGTCPLLEGFRTYTNFLRKTSHFSDSQQ